MAGGLGSRDVLDLSSAGSDNALEVGELGESCVGEYCKALLTVPVLNVTVLVAVSLGSLNVLDISKIVGGYALEIRDGSKSRIGEYGLALCAVPVLNVTGLMACSSLSLYVLDLSGAGSNYVLGVGELSESLILPELITVGAVPVLNVTVLVAVSLGSLNVLEVIGAGSGNNNVLDVGELGKSLVLPYTLTVIADPVLYVTGVVTSGSNSIEVNEIGVSNGYLDTHLVGNLGESLVGPCVSAVGAVPVLDVTALIAGRSLSLYVLNAVSGILVGELIAKHAVSIAGVCILMDAGCCNGNTLEGALGGEGLVGPYLVTCRAGPVLNVSCLGAGSCLSINVSCGVSGSGDYNIYGAGLSGKSLVGPYLVTFGTGPELDVSGSTTGCSSCLYVVDGMLVIFITTATGDKCHCYDCYEAKEQ